MNKICHSCKEEKPLEQFLTKPGSRVGRRGVCEDCFNGV
jgi:hypothetical protein